MEIKYKNNKVRKIYNRKITINKIKIINNQNKIILINNKVKSIKQIKILKI